MPRNRKDEFDDDAYETATDSDSDRAKKDAMIRQAPYLARVQVWARDDGPYTLKVGRQWFHCDGLIVNGVELRDASKQGVFSSRPQIPQSNAGAHPPSRPRRPPASRAQSYTRTRPDNASTSIPSSTPKSSGERLAAPDQYQPQSLATMQEQSQRHRAETPRQQEAQVHKQVQRHAGRERRDSGVSVSTDIEAQNAQLVPYSQPPSRPPLDRRPSKQTGSRRLRPGAVRRGSSYDIPVRSKSRKNVRFAPLPT